MTLEAFDLVSARAGRPVHAPVAFTLQPGEALLLEGANGSGKTTLLRTLAGFLPPAAGSATWQGRALDDFGWPLAHHWLGHGNGLKHGLTGAENLRVAAALAGGGIDQATDWDPFALQSILDVPVGQLSQGQRRRIALARLFLPKRPVWLLDEPAVGLDAASGRRLAGLIAEHLRQGGMAVVASHGDVRIEAPLVLEL